MSDDNLVGTFDALIDTADGSQVSVGQILQALRERGFGALLIGLSLLIVLPTGAIPLVPALCGLLIIIVCLQIIIGKQSVPVPASIADRAFDSDKIRSRLQRFRGWAQWLGQFFYPRLEVLTTRPWQITVACVCILQSIVIITIGFVPFVVMIPGASILILGVGMSFRDGYAILVGLISVVISLWATASIVGWV